VEVRLGHGVDEIDANGVTVAGERIASKTVIWTAGVAPSPAGNWLHVETDRAGRVRIQNDLTVSGHPEIFVVGDTATLVIASHGWSATAGSLLDDLRVGRIHPRDGQRHSPFAPDQFAPILNGGRRLLSPSESCWPMSGRCGRRVSSTMRTGGELSAFPMPRRAGGVTAAGA
jgi:hypothetical protein